MTRVAIVGCGIVGAAIAYELSQVPRFEVTVLDRQPPAQSATGAALGVLMGAISKKNSGRNLRMRLAGIQRYDDWILELETATGQAIPYNRQGILRLCFAGEDLPFWGKLAAVRQQQGWKLEVCDRVWLTSNYPYLNLEGVIGAVYSPQDRQLDPTKMTLALVAAAKQKGVTFNFNAAVVGVDSEQSSTGDERCCRQIHAAHESFQTDWLVIAAGLGSTALTAKLHRPLDIRPVLGQAVQVQLKEPLASSLQPVITGEDTHIVPLGQGNYWLGATVEFSEPLTEPTPDPSALETVMQRAIALCPALSNGSIVRAWSGLRPRPQGRPAPIIERLSGYRNVLLATGHYRNGVLLAPATAESIRQTITEALQ